MVMSHPAQPLAVIHLAGTQAQMGRQHGEIQRALGGHQPALDYYRQMPLMMLRGSQPHGILRTLPTALAPVIEGLTRRLEADRPEALRQRTQAFVQALGLPAAEARQVLVMDVFQNLVGVAGRVGVVQGARPLLSQAIAACSTLVAWGNATANGSLLHARNFDFPGPGIWDAAPTVVMCSPDNGLRYGFASTRGGDAPVVSLWNEAGLCLTTHTRLHRDVRFSGGAIIDICHDVIRQASTLAEAEALIRRRPPASTWGIVVSSAREQSAILVETTARNLQVTRPQPTATSLASTNHYLAVQLQPGELAPNSGYTAHSHGRLHRMERAVAEGRARGGLTAQDLQSLLGDHHDAYQPDLERAAGGVLAQPTGVHSIVIDPGAEVSYVSTGMAPAGRGPYLAVPWKWSTFAGFECHAPAESVQPPGAESLYTKGLTAQAYSHFLDAVAAESLGAEPAVTATHIVRAVQCDPSESTWQLLHAGFQMRTGQFDSALAALEQGIAHEQSPFYLGRLLLWASRLLDLRDRSLAARQVRDRLALLKDPLLGPLQRQADADKRHTWTRAKLRHVPIQVFMGAVG